MNVSEKSAIRVARRLARQRAAEYSKQRFMWDLIEKEKIDVMNWPFPDTIAGALIITDFSPVIIAVNKYYSDTLKIFTIAHELGHYFLNHGSCFCPQQMIENNTDKEIEITASAFASELLTPEKEIRQMVKEKNSIKNIAEAFELSERAINIRLNALGITHSL